MPAGKTDLYVEKGATFATTLTWRDVNNNPVDLTGYTARLQIRRAAAAEDVLVGLTSGAGLTLGGAAGTIAVRIEATVTAAIPADAGVYDLELQAADGTVTRLVEGTVTFSPEVTR